MIFKTITINVEKNWLLCSTSLVGLNEIVEVWERDSETPPQATGRRFRKVADPNVFIVYEAFDNHDAVGNEFHFGECCVCRVLMHNRSGARRRKFSADEKKIVNLVREEGSLDVKINRAKTGSVRKAPKKPKK